MLTEYEKYYKVNSLYNRTDVSSFPNWKFLQIRQAAVLQFSFAVLTKEAIKQLKPYAPFIEVGAGSGYWAYELQKRKIEVIPTDPVHFKYSMYKFKKQWTDIEKLSAVQAIRKYPEHTLLVVWPCYNKPWAYKALQAYKGNKFVYCGEGPGGCTADNSFHELLEEEWWEKLEIPILQWFGLHDYLRVYTRKEKK